MPHQRKQPLYNIQICVDLAARVEMAGRRMASSVLLCIVVYGVAQNEKLF